MNQPNPYQPPSAPRPQPGEIRGDRAYLLQVARYQKGILLCILAGIFGGVVQVTVSGPLHFFAVGVQVLISLASAVFAVLLAKTVYNVAGAVVCAVLTFVPCVGLLALLIINHKATRVLQNGGVKVGLLGANLADLQ